MRVCPKCFALYGPDQKHCPRDGEPTEDHIRLLIGRKLGPYVVKEVIGEGGMGVVYAGEHPTIGRRVALKVLRPELSLRDDLVDRFVQEARAVNTIGHLNIVNIYDFGTTPFGTFYIVMELLEGETMRELVDRAGPQPLSRVRGLVRGVGEALAAAHAKGFIHRDVKPENIMLVNQAGKEQFKLLDFGIVKLLTGDSMVKTQVDAGMGTPQYMSPEQLDQTTLDHRTDIYALAAVTYELLTGRVPYPARSAVEVRQLQLTQAPTPPSVLRADIQISRQLDGAVLWGLNLDINARCGSVADFTTAFEAGYRASSDEPPTVDLPPADAARRRWLRPSLLGALLVLLLGCSSIAYLLLRTPPGNADTGKTPLPSQTDARPAAARPRPPAPLSPTSRVRGVLEAGDTEQRLSALEMLGKVGRPVLENELIRLLSDADPRVRRTAARALGQMGTRQALGGLKRALGQSVSYAAVDIAEALARIGDPSGRLRLHAELDRAKDAFHRKYVLQALGELRDPRAAEWESFLAKHKLVDQQLRQRALAHLAALGKAGPRKALLKQLKAAPWPRRVELARLLLPAAPEPARQALGQALTQAPPDVRWQAAAILAEIGDASGAELLITSLRSQDPVRRRDSALALGHLPRERVAAPLRKALADPKEEVALAAAVALLDG